METNILRLAIQKKGRLADNSLELLKSAGIRIDNYSQQLLIKANNFDLELLFIRDDDIPEYVQDGIADIGIVGENVILESGKELTTVEKLGFGKCRMSIAIPKMDSFNSITDLEGKNIATTYPKILNNFLDANNINAKVHYISGSVEITPNINLADAIFDIVSTGSTLISNGLKEVETVLKSEAVLVSNNDLSESKKLLLEQILFRIRAVNKAKNNKYILLNAPNEAIENIIEMLPGVKSPTIMPLAIEGWSSVHTVISEDDFWNKIENLKNAGAQGILVLPIEKIIV
ncbi:MAG: ATP phosphoribosyltransferase [Bacteroidetes bacterium]|nr:ATP phosphoribosyltransferase [Bacteroidota bacterium]MBU1113799.1 ATP phosphoribosyltransferase [Bacteroidota bacterium]MBU1799615.1 ATP phosphoribosyltransferase [Bacteroidota bacterium]